MSSNSRGEYLDQKDIRERSTITGVNETVNSLCGDSEKSRKKLERIEEEEKVRVPTSKPGPGVVNSGSIYVSIHGVTSNRSERRTIEKGVYKKKSLST